MSSPAAVGFTVHTGWAAAVFVVPGPPFVGARSRVELAAEGHDARFVYHFAAEHPHEAERTIADAIRVARDRAESFLRDAVRDSGATDLIVALPPPRKALPPLGKILQAHPLIHSAEGELYRRAIEDAAASLRLRISHVAQGAALPVQRLAAPWGKDQKEAAARAWSALTGEAVR